MFTPQNETFLFQIVSLKTDKTGMNSILARACLFAAMLFFPLLSLAQENFMFLNSEQFEHLTSPEQKIYIQTLQSVIIEFDDQKDFAPTVGYLFPAFSLLFPSALAEDDVGSSMQRSNDNRIENSKISMSLVFLGVRIRAANERKTEILKTDVKENTLAIYDRLQALSKKNLTLEQKKNFETNLNNFRKHFANAAAIAPDLKSLSSKVGTLTAGTIISTVTAPNPAKKPTPSPGASARCIYAGFVIKTPTCEPLKDLPSDNRIDELGSSNFKCKSTREILCNPLVFGYQSDLNPYCTRRSASASKNCQQISNNTENAARIHSAWKNPKNKKAFDSFQSSLSNLCQANNNNSDVRSTCKVVVAHFNEKIKKEFPAQLAAGTSESKTDKSSKKN